MARTCPVRRISLPLVSTLVVHANNLTVSNLDIERNGLATDLTILNELLVPSGKIDGHRRALQAMGTAEDDLFLHDDC